MRLQSNLDFMENKAGPEFTVESSGRNPPNDQTALERPALQPFLDPSKTRRTANFLRHD
jgi:hypothetical protein